MKKKSLKIFVLTFFLLFGICVEIHSTPSIATTSIATTKTIKKGKIYIKMQKPSEYKKEIKAIEKALKKAPDLLTDKCKNVYLLDNTQFKKEAKKHHITDTRHVRAFTSSKDETIRIRLSKGKKHDYVHTLYHELAHVYDFYDSPKEGEGKYSSSKSFIKLYQNGTTNLSHYAESDNMEYFAEASWLYFKKPEELQARNYRLYQYLDDIYGKQKAIE